MDNLGAIGGPLLAIGLVASVGTRWAIALSVIPGLLAALAIVYAVRQTKVPTAGQPRPMRIRIRPVLVGPLRPLFSGIAAFEVGNCAATLLILRATELLEPARGQDSATTVALALYVAYNVSATLTSVPAGRHTDRVGAPRVLLLGAAALALGYLLLTRDTTSWILLLPAFGLAGIGIGCVETAEHAAVATHAPEHIRGSAFGLLAGVQSLGNLAASAIAGVLWTMLSPRWASAYLAAWMLVALAVFSDSVRRAAPTRRAV